MDQVRIGIIGIGNMGSAHASNIYQHKIEHLILTAVCDVDNERLEWAKQEFGSSLRRYTQYQEMIQSGDVDAVLIAVPHPLHPVIAIEALNAGIHVLLEKPAGIECESVRRMNEAWEASGKVFAIMYNQRTNSLYRMLKNDIEEGKLGTVKRFVWNISNWYRSQAYYDSAVWRATWNGEGGGVLMNQCPHNLDLWQWMIGMPKRIRAFLKYGHYHNIQVEDDASIYAEYENGATAVFLTSTGEYPGTNRIEVSGTRGKAVLEYGVLRYYLLEEDEREVCFHSKEAMPSIEIRNEQVYPFEEESGHIGILRNFTNAILYGEELISPGIEGINTVTLINAAYLSDWTNSIVELPLDEKQYLKYLTLRQENEQNRRKPEIQTEDEAGCYSERWNVRW